MTTSHSYYSYYYHYYYQDEWPESNPKKERNWREESKGTTQPRQGQQAEEEREGGGTFIWEPSHLIQEHTNTKKEKREVYCLLLCHSWLGTILMLYLWIDNDSSYILDRRGRYSDASIIHMVLIWIIHYSYCLIVCTNTIIYNNQHQ